MRVMRTAPSAQKDRSEPTCARAPPVPPQIMRMPAMKNSEPHIHQDQHVDRKSGSITKARQRQQQRERHRSRRHSGRLRRFTQNNAKQQAQRTRAWQIRSMDVTTDEGDPAASPYPAR